MKNNLTKFFALIALTTMSIAYALADNITYAGNEKVYFSSKQMSWGTVWAGDCDLYLQFANNGNNATRSNIATWYQTNDNTNGILVVTAPAGTYNQVKLLRTNKNDHNQVWNQSDYYTLQSGKNYLKDNGGSWDVISADPTVSGTYTLRGDLWLNGNGWDGGSSNNVPHFINAQDNKTASVSWVMPAAQARLTLCKNGSDQTSNQWNGSKSTLNLSKFESSKYFITAQSVVKKYTITYDAASDKIYGVYSNYDIDKANWDVYIDNNKKGTTDTNGELTISGLSSSNDGTAHTIYLRKKDATSQIHGVNWFGGLYIDKNASNVAWGTQYVYYDSNKFCNTQWPIVGQYDAKGRFKLNESKDVKVTFDGGKITINKIDPVITITSVALDKSTMKLVEGGATSTIAITATVPANLGEHTTTWTSNNENAATVNNGVVSPVAKGVATITCTVSNNNSSASATCTVTVKSQDEDCEMVWKEQYNGTGTIANPFDPQGQSEPLKVKKVQIKIGSQENHVAYYDANDANGYIKHGAGNSDAYYWYKIEAGDASYATDGKLYYLKNVANGKYLCISNVVIGTGNWGSNYTITADKTSDNATQCTWYFKQSNDKRLVNLSTKKNNTSNYEKGEMFLHRYSNVSSPANTYTVTGSSDGNQGNWQLTTSFVNETEVDNPDYKQPTIVKDSKTYYRFATNGTMTCTLTKALKVGDSISVYCYNTSSSAVAGVLRIGGTKVADINISAGVSTFGYIATAAGATEIVVATSSPDFCIAGVKVDRQEPDVFKESELKWDVDLTAGVNRTVQQGTFQHIATAKGSGVITYSSSDEEVAIVDATGTVTPVGAGTAVIRASLAQEGCYEGKDTTYNVTLTDLPKPTITFTTLPEDAPQGSIQQVVVTTTGGDNFALAITGGTDATLNITENTGTQITATLSFGANATDIELTASTTRIEGVLAATNKIATATIAACYPTGTEIFAFTMQGSDAAANQPAAGIIGGTVDQTALGTKGTADNPATLDACYLKLNEGKYIYDNNGSVEVKEQKDDAGKWALIPTGINYKPNWSNNTYKLYYIKNISTNKYMKRGAGQYGNNGQWLYYTTVTDATLGAGEEYQWFFSTDNDIVLVNKAGVRESLAASDHLHDCNQYNNVCDAYAAKPKVPCGITLDNMNAYTKIYDLASSTTTIPNPSFFKSVTYNEQTYYIISSEGKITIHCDLLSGDTIMLDVYNRQTQTASVEKIAIASAAAKYDYTTTNEYLCLAGISVFRPKVGDFITPTLSFEAMTQPKIVEVNTSFTHTATSNVSTMAAITYASSNTDVATVDATTGEVTIAADAANLSSATITATMAALGCYEEAVASYDLLVKNAVPGALQAAIDATEAGETLTLAWDYTGDNGEISKAITLDAQGHEVGNLTVTTTGNLTLASTLKTADLTLWAALGNQDNAAASAQVSGIEHITVQGDTWFHMDFDPSGAIQYGWYTMGVPFAVDATNGVYYLTAGGTREKITRGINYLFWAYDGAKRATGANGWGRFSGVLQPNTLYLITPDDELSTNTFCFLRHSGNIGGSASITLAENAATDPTNAGWNGVANSTLNYRNLSFSGDKVQLFNHDTEGFDVTSVADHTFVMGSAFFAQADGEETLLLTTTDQPGALRAPQRAAEATAEINIRLGANTSSYSDQLFVSTTQENKTTYQIGHDLVKMTYNAAKVPQLAVNAYNVSLCDAEMVLDAQGQAFFPLTITSPSDENYMLYIHGEANQDVYVLENGNIIGHLNKGAVSLQIAKGTTTHYSLLILGTERGIVTDLSEPQESNQVEKILLNHTLYILRDGKLYDALGR